jgi:cobalt/nickel transport system permease protein
MQHSTIDQHANESTFKPFDPRAKIIAIIFFVVIIAVLRDFITLFFGLIFILSVQLFSKVPARHYIKRYSLAFPFIIFAALTLYFVNSMIASISMFIRISTCVLALIILSSTTPFFDLLKGFQRLKVPKIFIILLMFTYRYFFVFIEELHRMKLARKSKGFQGGKHLFDKQGMKTISFTAGMVLVRAYQRGVRIYDSLMARGYTGEIKTLTELKFKNIDYSFFLIFISISIILFYYDWIVIT